MTKTSEGEKIIIVSYFECELGNVDHHVMQRLHVMHAFSNAHRTPSNHRTSTTTNQLDLLIKDRNTIDSSDSHKNGYLNRVGSRIARPDRLECKIGSSDRTRFRVLSELPLLNPISYELIAVLF